MGDTDSQKDGLSFSNCFPIDECIELISTFEFDDLIIDEYFSQFDFSGDFTDFHHLGCSGTLNSTDFL